MAKTRKKQPKLPWYRTLNGRFEPYIEAALASDDSRRRNLAWIMMMEVGSDRGAQRRFAQRLGWSQGRLAHLLSGRRNIQMDAVLELAQILERPVEQLERWDHPLAFVSAQGAVEPGDARWEALWIQSHGLDPVSFESPRVLRKRWPFLFPQADLEASD